MTDQGGTRAQTEHEVGWAMQVLGSQQSTFSERVEARTVIGGIAKRADDCQGALERIRAATRDRDATDGFISAAWVRAVAASALDQGSSTPDEQSAKTEGS